jgi:hypothetical protein
MEGFVKTEYLVICGFVTHEGENIEIHAKYINNGADELIPKRCYVHSRFLCWLREIAMQMLNREVNQLATNQIKSDDNNAKLDVRGFYLPFAFCPIRTIQVWLICSNLVF